jgi:hypothetical protein
MVTFQKRNQFWRRNEAGKYLPSVEELRSLFLEAGSWLDEAEEFRASRIQLISSGRIPSFSSTSPVCLIHIIPLGRFHSHLDLQATSHALFGKFEPLDPEGHSGRFNADGYLRYKAEGIEGKVLSYGQVFRFGAIEGGTSTIATIGTDPLQQAGVLWGKHIQTVLVRFADQAIDLLRSQLDTPPPYAILVSYLRIRDYRLQQDGTMKIGRPIDVDEVLAPTVVSSGDATVGDLLRPAFDVLWQSSGFSGQPPAQ